MNLRKCFLLALCVVGILLFSSITQAQPHTEADTQSIAFSTPITQWEQELLEAAYICHDIYINSEHADTLNVVLRPDTIENMVTAVADLGNTVTDGDQIFNMQNPEPLMDFGSNITDFAAWYTVHSDGHLGLSILTRSSITSLSANFTDSPSIYMETEFALKSVKYTEKGWLIFERDLSTSTNPKQFNVDPHTMIRVSPLSDTYRSLCEMYIAPIGYAENNLFTTNWSEDDFTQVDFSSLYAMLYGLNHDGNNLTRYTASGRYEQLPDSELFLIPAEEFESTVRQFLNIPVAALRSGNDYSATLRGYYFLGWHTGYYDVVPRLPTPEVVDVRHNSNGTITLVVDALYSWYGTDCAFTHEVTIRVRDDGSFQYVSNRVISDTSTIFPERKLQSLRNSAISRLSP